jgi:hypothetical protein
VRPSRFQSVSKLALQEPGSGAVQPHIIVVVGAGASNAACGLPAGAKAADQLRIEMRNRVGNTELDDEIERLSLQFNLAEGDFETILLALSKYDRRYILRRLSEIFGRRYHPWLGYEILAHCLKHRFIDAIINFNFDEILDQTIADELGDGGFHKIILDGDCPSNPADWIHDTKHKFHLPLYLKPHGSASQPSSLRFTRDSYTALADGFVAVLTTLFAADRPVHILVLGHAMQSIEFNHLLRRATKGRDPKNAMKFYFVEEASARLERFTEGMTDHTYTLMFPEKSLDIAVALEIVWSNVCQNFKDDEKPRGIERHKLISTLFESRRIANWPASGRPDELAAKTKRLVNYFKDRTYVEIALSIAKAKGFASMEDLSNARVGTYFRLYREQILRWGAVHGGSLKSLNDACAELKLKRHGYGDSAVALGVRREDADKESTTIVVNREVFALAAIDLARTTLELIDTSFESYTPDDVRNFTDVLLTMYDGEEVEVSIGHGKDRSLSFEKAEILPTLTALKWRTEQLISDRSFGWDRMACTAKSGQWLLRSQYVDSLVRDNRDVKLSLVVCDMAYADDLASQYRDHLLTPIRWLPWWLHNRNVTIFLSGDRPIYAISFERRMRTASIAPLYLTAEADVRYAWNSFVAYGLRADRFKNGTRDDHITERDLREAERRLLDEF